MREVEVEVDEVLPAGSSSRSPRASDDAFSAFVAKLMDNIFVVPGTQIRFGIDPLIGLIPGFGDTAGAFVSAVLILQSAQRGVPKIVLLRMALNVLINSALGAIPVVGDLFSVYFKSNARNYELLQRHGSGPRRTSTAGDWAFVILLLGGMFASVIFFITLTVILVGKILTMGQPS